jgi:hypothetical protein
LLLLPTVHTVACRVATFFLGIPRCVPSFLPGVPRTLAIVAAFFAYPPFSVGSLLSGRALDFL